MSINWFYARVFARFALDNPELLTSLRLLEPVGIRSKRGTREQAIAYMIQ